MKMQLLALAFLAAVTIGGLAWVFVYPLLSGERKALQRRASFARIEPVARQAEKTQRSRREQIEGSPKEVEERRLKQKNVALGSRLTQAGLNWSKQKFLVISGILGAFGFFVPLLLGGGPIAAICRRRSSPGPEAPSSSPRTRRRPWPTARTVSSRSSPHRTSPSSPPTIPARSG